MRFIRNVSKYIPVYIVSYRFMVKSGSTLKSGRTLKSSVDATNLPQDLYICLFNVLHFKLNAFLFLLIKWSAKMCPILWQLGWVPWCCGRKWASVPVPDDGWGNNVGRIITGWGNRKTSTIVSLFTLFLIVLQLNPDPSCENPAVHSLKNVTTNYGLKTCVCSCYICPLIMQLSVDIVQNGISWEKRNVIAQSPYGFKRNALSGIGGIWRWTSKITCISFYMRPLREFSLALKSAQIPRTVICRFGARSASPSSAATTSH